MTSSVEMITQTLTSTATYTIYKCPATTTNCPASMSTQPVIAKSIVEYITICPAAEAMIPTSIPPYVHPIVTPILPSSPVLLTICPTPIVTVITYAP
jgi:hypothetical protein